MKIRSSIFLSTSKYWIKTIKKTTAGTKLFTTHDDGKFEAELSRLVNASYSALFDLHGKEAWKLDRDDLISFFRGTDETSAIVGGRQALTFQTLASLAGQRENKVVTKVRAPKPATSKTKKPKNTQKNANQSTPKIEIPGTDPNVGLTVRIEINLPANGSEATYDNIFKSIRKNLLNG